jgi:hypothetical protein
MSIFNTLEDKAQKVETSEAQLEEIQRQHNKEVKSLNETRIKVWKLLGFPSLPKFSGLKVKPIVIGAIIGIGGLLLFGGSIVGIFVVAASAGFLAWVWKL